MSDPTMMKICRRQLNSRSLNEMRNLGCDSASCSNVFNGRNGPAMSENHEDITLEIDRGCSVSGSESNNGSFDSVDSATVNQATVTPFSEELSPMKAHHHHMKKYRSFDLSASFLPIFLPIDRGFEAKYTFNLKGAKRDKTIQEIVYLFLEHPCGCFCFSYHISV